VTSASPGHSTAADFALGAELVLLNLWDEIDTFGGLVPDVLQPQDGRGRVYAQIYEYSFDR
jgi:hypothetical protein